MLFYQNSLAFAYFPGENLNFYNKRWVRCLDGPVTGAAIIIDIGIQRTGNLDASIMVSQVAYWRLVSEDCLSAWNVVIFKIS